MCILFLHTNSDPQDNEYRLIIATNRDEYFIRPSKSAYKCTKTNVIAGRDMEPGREGGSWLGFTIKHQNTSENQKLPKYCFACLTNMSAAPKPENPIGRGQLVIDYLESDLNYPEYFEKLQQNGLNYNGYNLIIVEMSEDKNVKIYHHSNIPLIETTFTGTHTLGFSNSSISSPYMKVHQGKELFQNIIDKKLDKTTLKEELINLLKNRTKFLPDKELAKRGEKALEKLSSIYVDFREAGYGTRTHTVILIDKQWNVEFTEVTMEEPIVPENPQWITTTIKSNL